MDYLLIFFAALLVSADTLATGIYLGSNKLIKPLTILSIPLACFVLCLAAVYIGNFIDLSFGVLIGGVVLVFVGMRSVKSTLSGTDNEPANKKSNRKEVIALAFSLSIDNAVTAFSFGTFDYNSFAVAGIFTGVTFLFLLFGILISRIRLPKAMDALAFLSGLILTGLGVYKIVCFFL